MMSEDLHDLAALLKQERDTLLARWRDQVRALPSARNLDVPSLNDHMPGVLDELATALESNSEKTIPEATSESSPPAHGLQRLQEGFDIEEVVAEYNILRGCIHDLADENGRNLQGKPFHIINRVFDHAIGLALQTYTKQRELDLQRRREEYLAFVAHDLRTPLNAIALAGRVLELTIPERGACTDSIQMLRTLRRNVQYLEDLVCKVLEENTHSQSDDGVKVLRREFDLWPLVESLIHDLQCVADFSGTHLINQVPDDLVVYADASFLRRVIQNLLANAIKYAPKGTVVVAAQVLEDEGAVECRVTDDGVGIPENLLEKIFVKGETDSENEGGTGLGLAIVKAFTEAHGGNVNVESKQGAGSTFRISFPGKKGVKGSTDH